MLAKEWLWIIVRLLLSGVGHWPLTHSLAAQAQWCVEIQNFPS